MLQHIQDPAALRALTRCLSGPPPSSSESRTEFETLTSAINITPTSNGRYDINQIKEDALWLSKEATIDEVSALRLTVLEWQSRQAERLLQGDLLDATGDLATDRLNASIQASSLLSPGALAKTVQHVPSYDFDSLAARHSRLLMIFVSELQYLLQSAQCLVTQAILLAPKDTSSGHPDAAQPGEEQEEVGVKILKSWQVADGWSERSKPWLAQLLSFIDRRLESLSKESGWRIENELSLDLEQQWSKANVLRMISALHISLAVCSSSSSIASPIILLGWFRLMGRLGFLRDFDIVSAPIRVISISWLI